MEETFEDVREKLVQLATTLGYKINYTTGSPNSMNFNRKIITLSPFCSLKDIYSFVHELGHCIDYSKEKFNTKKYNSNKLYRLWKEFIGWWYGFKLCVKYKIPIKKYPSYAFNKWITYIKYT